MRRSIIRGARVFDGYDLLPTTASIVVEGDRIAGIERGLVEGRFDEDIDGAGHLLMPGLIDAHVHVYAYEANLSRMYNCLYST